MRDALSDSEKFAIVSLYELLESGNIPILARLDKIQVIICLCSYSELCRLCSHNRSMRFGEQQLWGSNGCFQRCEAVPVAMPSTSPCLTAPRPCRSSLGVSCSSRDTFPPW